MKPVRFDYLAPTSLADARAALADAGDGGVLLAGGQSLVPMLNFRLVRPSVLIDLNRIAGLAGITIDGDRLAIGAMTRHADVANSDLVRAHCPLISQAMVHVAHAAVRNRGTFGGSLALSDPAAEMPCCVVCLDGDIVLSSVRGERHVAAADFFNGLYGTAREADEILTGAILPRLGAGWFTAFHEVARRHGDLATAGVALALRIDDGAIAECRIALCGVEEFPRRLATVEQYLAGERLDAIELDEAVNAMADTLTPMSDAAYTGTYRLHVAQTLLKRAIADIKEACARAA